MKQLIQQMSSVSKIRSGDVFVIHLNLQFLFLDGIYLF